MEMVRDPNNNSVVTKKKAYEGLSSVKKQERKRQLDRDISKTLKDASMKGLKNAIARQEFMIEEFV